MIYQLVWATKDEFAFEQTVPLQWHGDHIAKNGWENNIKIGFLEGIQLLSKDYLRKLELLGYDVIDCNPLVNKLLREYPELRTYDTTNKYWFLRWNVLDSLASGCPNDDTIIHFDSDVVFMADPRELCSNVQGKTFALEGCPVLTAISDKDWFSVWRNELANFLSNPESYLEEALRIKDQPIKSPREFCNFLYYQPGRFHDQDMIEYLIAAGLLPQARTADIFNSRFYWMHNPIVPGEWFEEQCRGFEKRVVERGERAFVGNKQVAFYHFQMDFARYCYRWLQLHKLGLARLAASVRGNPDLGTKPFSGKIISEMIKFFTGKKHENRRDIYDMVYQKNPDTGNFYITDIVNSCW